MSDHRLFSRASLRHDVACSALALASLTVLAAAPAHAQVASPTTPTAPQAEQPPAPVEQSPVEPADAAAPAGGDIVVTGSILRTTDRASPSPVTTVSAEALDQRGVTTVQEGIQQLTSNNGPALTNSFTANGAFAGGASAVSLRGLSTNSTLVLFDGVRAAYYPLSDDGTRNFVDLNTIPDDIVDRIEVLRDGASSSYGADAIAGVVNIITKRQYKGIGGRAEAGISERGDASNQRLSLIAGTGDLDDNGYNAYVSGFYFRQSALYNRDRPYPYNSDDRRRICNDGACGPNQVVNGLDGDGGYTFSEGVFNTGGTLYVRPFDPTNTTAQGRYQQLNPALGCARGPGYTLSAADLARTDDDGNLVNAAAPTSVCQDDLVNNDNVISPQIERFGGSARFTARVGDNAEAYAMFNFQQSRVGYTGSLGTIRANANAGIDFPRFTTSGTGGAFAPGSYALTLPVYVCANGVGAANGIDTGCNASNGTLNPNNPFAVSGQVARIVGRLPSLRTYDETRSRVYRAALGIKGQVADTWDYAVDATAMHTDLRRLQQGYVRIDNLLTAIARGTYDFVDPFANTQAQQNFLSPDNVTDAQSDLAQVQATLGRSLATLPGGPLQLGLGIAYRYESINSPSANPDYNGPTDRYFVLNAFGIDGSRSVYSAFAELNAPIVDQFLVNVSGRYDRYSSGQSAFSPKVGAKFTPFRQLAIRGTYSRGFRIPSFGEANSLPTSGFVNASKSTYSDAFLAQYGCSQATFTSCPAYISNSSYGQTTRATPDLKPEKSRSFTAGVIFEPIRQLTLTVDYFNIKKTDAIAAADNQAAIDAYNAGQDAPAGFGLVPDVIDPNFPNARPRLAFVEASYVNENTIRSQGIDFGATGTLDFADDVSFTSAAQASLILELSTEFADGSKQTYQGTLGNYNLTAGSGTPRWRGTWQNTLNYKAYTLSATAQYFDGYNLSAEDQGGTRGDCSLNPGYVPCDVKSYITVDLTGSVKINDRATFYVNVVNLLDDLPPIDPVTYGANLYNPVQGGTGIFGRMFRAGFKVGL
ncbi:TonB-dependent receptor domain-containing protein [Sphingomonas folli]|uniref:TonB-dependent receptor domain-containing protein n=1 Tax=Sphingomonas folli TaxID=2862497 RepID=UPI0027E42451|nr:TonB-dependent receptor [Sphingomonas folli]